MSRTFCEALMREVLQGAANTFALDFDPATCQKKRPGAVARLKHAMLKFAGRKGFVRFDSAAVAKAMDSLSPYWAQIEWLHGQLADDWSRTVLAKVIAYRILGLGKIRLPLDTADFWRNVKRVEALADHACCIDPGFRGWELPRLNLASLNVPATLHTVPAAAHIIFQEEQYAYRHAGVSIEVQEGNVVLDLGGCWGDTALYFAHKAGKAGKVYSFEFMPQNLNVLRTNLDLNPELQKRITVIQAPVWSRSGEVLTFAAAGPGSKALAGSAEGGSVKASTVTIDDFVMDAQLAVVDFIKMDIEGAELEALKGAEATIRKWRPTLAIAVYHSLADLAGIPKWITSLGVGYQLFMGHYGLNEWETVLFCQSSGKTS